MEKLHNFLHDINLFLHELKETPQHLQIFFHNLSEGQWIYYLELEGKENWELNYVETIYLQFIKFILNERITYFLQVIHFEQIYTLHTYHNRMQLHPTHKG